MSLFFDGDTLSPQCATGTNYPSRFCHYAIILNGISVNYDHHNLLNKAKCAPAFLTLIWVRISLMQRV